MSIETSSNKVYHLELMKNWVVLVTDGCKNQIQADYRIVHLAYGNETPMAMTS
jgi:hypothetical protein